MSKLFDSTEAAPKPDIHIARAAAQMRLVKQKAGEASPGELYPLYTELATFDRFGDNRYRGHRKELRTFCVKVAFFR